MKRNAAEIERAFDAWKLSDDPDEKNAFAAGYSLGQEDALVKSGDSRAAYFAAYYEKHIKKYKDRYQRRHCKKCGRRSNLKDMSDDGLCKECA